jgi:hypothetical protein
MIQNSYNPNHKFLKKLTLSDDINEKTAKDVIDFISIVNDMDSYIDPSQREPINIILNSVGGSMYDGFAIIGAIEHSLTPVHITCLGSAMSMALVILASGKHRIGHPLSSYMYHECLDDIAYEKMFDLETINPTFKVTDLVLVIGANDVVNPLARDPQSSIAGMPILNVDDARTCIVIKRSLGSGFAGLANPLFTYNQTLMLFNDAKKAIEQIVKSYHELG